MRVLILGGGGLGTVYAGYLARAGIDVTLLVKPEHKAALEGNEVHITGMQGFRAPVRFITEPDPGAAYDYLIVCVKGRDTERALASVLAVDVATVLSLQNGVRKDEVLVRWFGRSRVLGAVSMVGGTLVRPGHVRHSLAMPTLIGELDGTESFRAARLADAMQASGLPAAAVPDIVTREWDKIAGFLRTALVCSIARTDIASALLDPDLIQLCIGIVKEVAAVAAAEGHPLGATPDSLIGDPYRSEAEMVTAYRLTAAEMQATGPPTVPSLAQDIIAGRPSELEETAGDVVARAERRAVSVPILSICTALVRAIERRASVAVPERSHPTAAG